MKRIYVARQIQEYIPEVVKGTPILKLCGGVVKCKDFLNEEFVRKAIK